MFGNQKGATAKPIKRVVVTRDTPVTILTSGCHFQGKLFCRGSTRIGGQVEGEIVSEGILIIEEEASIKARVTADEVLIQGHIEGQLEARGRVELCANGVFEGDIITPILVVQEGAHFNGRAKMPMVQQKTGKNTPHLVAHDGANSHMQDDGHKIEPIRDIAVMKTPEISPT